MTDKVTLAQLYNATVQVFSTVELKCLAGSKSSTGYNNPIACERCPLGTYSGAGATSCTECPINLPRTLTTGAPSLSSCVKCPLGFYCPVGMSPQPCPGGFYEPIGADVRDRTIATCEARTCAEGYWCGAGASEGGSYQKNVIFPEIVSAASVLGLEKSIHFDIGNALSLDTIEIAVTSTLPSWLTIPLSVSIDSSSSSSINAVMNTTLFADVNSDLFGHENASALINFEWYRTLDPSTTFSFHIRFDFTMVTVIVTPAEFRYSANQGSNDLTPPIPTKIDVFNTMCSYSVSVTIKSISCSNGLPFPPWISFTDADPFSTKTIEEQAGLPTTIRFELISDNLEANDSPIGNIADRYVLTETPPAEYETTCIKFDFTVDGQNINVTRQVSLLFRLLRKVSF